MPKLNAGFGLSIALQLAALPALADTECWIKRQEADGQRSAAHAPLYRALLAAEDIIARNQAFLATPVPTRNQSAISAGHWGGQLWIAAYPEKTPYAQVWTKGGCTVYAAAGTINAGIGQIAVFLNGHVDEQFLMGHAVPRLEGTLGGYPVYNGWVVMTRDARLPWIPQTLADRFQREQVRREKKLAEWRQSQAGMKPPDMAAMEQSAAMIRKTDPAGADKMLASLKETEAQLRRLQDEVYPATGRQLERALAEVARVRATFTPGQLAAPATWTDQSGKARQQLDARVQALRALPPQDQQAVNAIAQESRALVPQLQQAERGGDKEGAARLRAELAALTRRSRAISGGHMEKAAIEIADLSDAYELAHLQPGDGSNVLAYKADPSFPDRKDLNRVQLITLRFAPKGQAEGRGPWMKAVTDSFDFAAMAALLK